jgi:anti-sigma regulatory factor (Ser/Thr protein kinase)
VTTDIRFTRRLPAAAPSIPAARGLLDGICREITPESCEIARLLLSEVATNAVLHGASFDDGCFEVSITWDPDDRRLHVSVLDAGDPFSWRRSVVREIGGQGLRLVDELATTWGTRRGGDKVVWFELVDRGTSASVGSSA